MPSCHHQPVPPEFCQKIVDVVLRGESINGIAKRFQFPYSTVYSVWKRYEEIGDVAAGQRGGARRAPSLQDEHLEHLVGFLARQPGATLEELKAELELHFGADNVTVSLSTLGRALEERAHMTLKRLHIEHDRHNSEATIRARQDYAHHFRLEGRSYSDQERPTNRQRNVSLLVAVDNTGIRAHKTIIGAWNSSKLIDFFNEHIFPLFHDGQHATFVMDNARFHHNPAFLNVVAQHGHRVEFLPPYSPWLNIAENVFGKIKPVVTRQELTDHGSLVNIIEHTLQTVTPADCDGWIREATRWLVVAEAGHPLGHDHDAATSIQRFNL
ncbi:uncharacterized protein UTRI_10112 [Ustilago trichophora]|uniref:Paired domain-containing protein n=1 Tax=Ustilago trichophora TaxID=86804 RepID=A0A5C3E4J7_9BASI|nr:uncharacterized protein UTRI_10112 [Ustilago trichophora]